MDPYLKRNLQHFTKPLSQRRLIKMPLMRLLDLILIQIALFLLMNLMLDLQTMYREWMQPRHYLMLQISQEILCSLLKSLVHHTKDLYQKFQMKKCHKILMTMTVILTCNWHLKNSKLLSQMNKIHMWIQWQHSLKVLTVTKMDWFHLKNGKLDSNQLTQTQQKKKSKQHMTSTTQVEMGLLKMTLNKL